MEQIQETIKFELTVRDAQVVKAILEQQLMNSGMGTYMNITHQMQEQLPAIQARIEEAQAKAEAEKPLEEAVVEEQK